MPLHDAVIGPGSPVNAIISKIQVARVLAAAALLTALCRCCWYAGSHLHLKRQLYCTCEKKQSCVSLDGAVLRGF